MPLLATSSLHNYAYSVLSQVLSDFENKASLAALHLEGGKDRGEVAIVERNIDNRTDNGNNFTIGNGRSVGASYRAKTAMSNMSSLASDAGLQHWKPVSKAIDSPAMTEVSEGDLRAAASIVEVTMIACQGVVESMKYRCRELAGSQPCYKPLQTALQ